MSDLSDYAADLEAWADNLEARASQVVRKTAMDTTADAKALAPVDTGNLRNSIITANDGPLRAASVATASYAPFVEFGTSRMAPQPFMGPAQERRTPAFFDAIAELAEGL